MNEKSSITIESSLPPFTLHRDEDSDEMSSSSDPSTVVRSEKSTGTKEETMAQRDTRVVKRSKMIVYIVIAVAAATVGALTYILTSQSEATNFQLEFSSYASEVIDEAERSITEILGQLQTFSHIMTSFVITSNDTWPYVSLPYFELHSRDSISRSKLEAIVYAPIVQLENKTVWEEYSWTHQDWIDESVEMDHSTDVSHGNVTPEIRPYNSKKEDYRHHSRLHEQIMDDEEAFGDEIAVPIWQVSPVPNDISIINIDLNTIPELKHVIIDGFFDKHAFLSGVLDLTFLSKAIDKEEKADNTVNEQPDYETIVFQPVLNGYLETANVTGFILGKFNWISFFEDVLPDRKHGIVVELTTCGANFTYQINGEEVVFVGEGQHHEVDFEYLKETYVISQMVKEDDTSCDHILTIFPSYELEATYHTSTPAIYTTVVVLVFFFTAFTFFIYDFVVDRRQRKLLASANRTAAIVSNMFPKEVQKRILEEAEAKAELENQAKKRGRFGAKSAVGDFLEENGDDAVLAYSQSRPNADFFPEVTIMFADIVGFTAWSSTREPQQVFSLLESIFNEYDLLAARRRVFKVETVGDCYVAVAGLPEPRHDHALVMVRFARDCLYKFSTVVKQLEVTLGPDTSDLGMRFGLHSGPVTAGVLRGDRARFQLFGDTMNTCARIESTGLRNKIHLSQETVDRLVIHGKGHWCRQREDKVVAKGKGELTTYWLLMKGDIASTAKSSSSEDSEPADSNEYIVKMKSDHLAKIAGSKEWTSTPSPTLHRLSEKKVRLVCWNVEALANVLREMVARRDASGVQPSPVSTMRALERNQQERKEVALEEVKEVIPLPTFDEATAKRQRDASTIDLGPAVMEQLQDYLQTIAALYRENSFHNFEHASHVTMSVVKLLSRIVAPSHLVIGAKQTDTKDVKKDLHDHTYGITSDPLTQFAVILAALIHDVDHTGVPNSQLVKEQASIAAVYKDKSVAEQNSIDIAWDLLMHDEYEDLRRVIYSTEDEFRRFRQLLVNVVLATDIMDKELNAARKARWNVAFAESPVDSHDSSMVHRKATIVIEHLIQASDVAHTMQHWQVYRKWNARFFEESYTAFVQGRAETNPADKWYEGEIGFFDFYIIPLAKKLKNCGVFGVSSDEYLNYALQNRKEWELHGRQVIEEMVESLRGTCQERASKE